MLNKVKTIVLRAAGTNCDRETAHAFELAGSEAEPVHVNSLIRGDRKLVNYHILAIAGGFSYGDDIAAGRVFANELMINLREQMSKFTAQGKLVIGICNGFQVLAKTGLLPGLNGKAGADSKKHLMTVFDNNSGRYECRWVYLKRGEDDKCVFTRGLPEIIPLPVAHGEGKVMFDSDETLDLVRRGGQAVFRYVDENGRFGGYPVNPNGATDHIAGVCDPTGRIFGLMPHPERFVLKWHHPSWTRGDAPAVPSGMLMFKNAVKFAKKNL